MALVVLLLLRGQALFFPQSPLLVVVTVQHPALVERVVLAAAALVPQRSPLGVLGIHLAFHRHKGQPGGLVLRLQAHTMLAAAAAVRHLLGMALERVTEETAQRLLFPVRPSHTLAVVVEVRDQAILTRIPAEPAGAALEGQQRLPALGRLVRPIQVAAVVVGAAQLSLAQALPAAPAS